MPGRDQRSRNKVDHRGDGRGARTGKKYVEEEDFDAIARRNRDVEQVAWTEEVLEAGKSDGVQIKRRQQQQAEEEESSSDDEPAAAAAAPARSKRAPEVKPAAGSDSDDDIAPIGADQKHQPTRREREAAAKEAVVAHKAYLEKQAKGETAEFKAQARRLAEVRARREAAAKKRESEEAAMAEAGVTGSTEGPAVGVQAGREPPNRPTSALAEAMGATTMTAGPRRRGGGKKKGKH